MNTLSISANALYSNNMVSHKTDKSSASNDTFAINDNTSFASKDSMYADLKKMFPQLNINYGSISSSAGESTLKSLAYGTNYGNLYNLTIDPNVEKKMQSDPKLRDDILKQVAQQMSTPIPYIPGIKVASAGAIVHSDGSVSGYIVGQPDESAKKAEKDFKVYVRKKHREEAEKQAEQEKIQEAVNLKTELLKHQKLSSNIASTLSSLLEEL